MRGCAITLGCLGLLLGYAAAGGSAVATLTYLIREGGRAVHGVAQIADRDHVNARELERCQRIGALAGDDPRCQAAWSENRRRFLDYGPSTGTGTPHP